MYPDIDFAARWPDMAARWRRMVEGGAEMHVALRGGRLAGFIVVDPGQGYLDQIAVAPEARGLRIGRALIALAKARAPQGLALHVNVTNSPAIRFYEREGFARTGEAVNPRSGLPVHKYEWRP